MSNQGLRDSDSDISVEVAFYPPPADLEGFFTTFYCVEINPGNGRLVEDALHPEWGNLRIFSGSRPDNVIDGQRLSGADVLLTGPSSSPLHFTLGQTRLWGIGIQPLGWATFIGKPADQFANTIHDVRKTRGFGGLAMLADNVLEREGDEKAQLDALVQFFRNEAPRHGKLDPRIAAIHMVLVEPELPHVSDLADRCALNQRTLERLCRKHFGFPPKLLLRRQRFMRSLAQFMLDPSLGWIGVIDSLYFDQSHFVRDCKEFLGMSPTDYAATPHPIMAGFLRERMRAHGSAVQTLDRPDQR